MLAFSIAILTATAATGAFWAMADSWRRYGKAALALRGALRECQDWQEVRFTITELEVRPAGALILRPAFGVRPARLSAQPALRAAA